MLMVGMILVSVVGLVLLNRWDKSDKQIDEYCLMECTDARWLKLNAAEAKGIEKAEKYADVSLRKLNAMKRQKIETAQECAKMNACC